MQTASQHSVDSITFRWLQAQRAALEAQLKADGRPSNHEARVRRQIHQHRLEAVERKLDELLDKWAGK